MKKLLSIVIPTYNRVKFLKRCLKSIDLKHIKINEIIVDDGSFYDVKKNLKIMEKIKIYRIKNSGRTYALFYGINKATSKYSMIMDDDDYFIKNKLNIVLKLLKDNENFNSVNCFAFGTIIKKK